MWSAAIQRHLSEIAHWHPFGQAYHIRSNFWMTKFKNIVGKQVGITKNISKIHCGLSRNYRKYENLFSKKPISFKIFTNLYICTNMFTTICEGLWCLWGDHSTCSLILFLYWPKISAHLQKSSENVCKQWLDLPTRGVTFVASALPSSIVVKTDKSQWSTRNICHSQRSNHNIPLMSVVKLVKVKGNFGTKTWNCNTNATQW